MYFAVRASDKRIACEEEFSDSEDEGEGAPSGARRHRENFGIKRRRKDDFQKKDERTEEEKKEIKQELELIKKAPETVK